MPAYLPGAAPSSSGAEGSGSSLSSAPGVTRHFAPEAVWGDGSTAKMRNVESGSQGSQSPSQDPVHSGQRGDQAPSLVLTPGVSPVGVQWDVLWAMLFDGSARTVIVLKTQDSVPALHVAKFKEQFLCTSNG